MAASGGSGSRPAAGGRTPARFRLAILAIGAAILIALAAIRVIDPYPLPGLRAVYFDTLQRIDPREAQDLPVRVVDIDEAALAAYGQWPWPRDQLADLVLKLADYGVAVVAFDVLFSEPDRLSPSRLAETTGLAPLLTDPDIARTLAQMDNDQRLAGSFAALPVVLGVASATTASETTLPPKAGFVQLGQAPADGLIGTGPLTPVVPMLAKAAAGIGDINVSPGDSATVVRQVPLAWDANGIPLPSLAFESLRLAVGESTFLLHGTADLDGVITSVQVGPFEAPTTDNGELWVRYRHNDPALYVSAADVLAPGVDPALAERLAGHIVLVGTSAAGLLDIRLTALGEPVPGVSIHAQIIEQVLSGDYLYRSDFIAGTEFLILFFLGLIVTTVMSISSPAISMAAGSVATAVVLGASWFAFQRGGVLLDITYPVLGGLVNFGAITAFQFVVVDRDKRRMRKSFSHYVSEGVLSQIEASGHQLDLSGVEREMTIMFCDIRGFTSISEHAAPQDVVAMLNALFTELSHAIHADDGTIDKFIGDAIMAFWNAPLETELHEEKSCRAALHMRQAVVRFNEMHEVPGGGTLRLAIGCATGMACVGNIGSQDRFNYSVIGDTVNVASRIETACRHVDYDILVAGDTAEASPHLARLYAGALEMKGKSERVGTWIVVGDKALAETEGFKALVHSYEQMIAALVAGEPADALLAKCLAGAEGLEPGLPAYLHRCAERASDFT